MLCVMPTLITCRSYQPHRNRQIVQRYPLTFKRNPKSGLKATGSTLLKKRGVFQKRKYLIVLRLKSQPVIFENSSAHYLAFFFGAAGNLSNILATASHSI